MAILLVNKKTLQVSVQSKPGEKVSKDRDLTNIQEESEKLGKRYKKLYKEYQKLLEKCHKWNIKHDKNYRENIEKNKSK